MLSLFILSGVKGSVAAIPATVFKWGAKIGLSRMPAYKKRK